MLVALDISRRTFNRIRINYVWAMGYNTLMIPVAAGVFYPLAHHQLPPWLAGLCMAFSSVSVVASSLLLRRYRRPPRVLREVVSEPEYQPGAGGPGSGESGRQRRSLGDVEEEMADDGSHGGGGRAPLLPRSTQAGIAAGGGAAGAGGSAQRLGVEMTRSDRLRSA